MRPSPPKHPAASHAHAPPAPGYLATATPRQLAAMETAPERWLAVRAGAGAGKTFVLAARFVRLLEHGTRIERIAAITFTRKAAAEMSARVLALLSARLAELRVMIARDDARSSAAAGEIYERLLTARARFHAHRIGTIDAFCRSQLGAHAIEAGLEPGFAVLDEKTASTRLDDSLTRTMRELSHELGRAGIAAPAPDVRAFALLNDWFGADKLTDILKLACNRRRDFDEFFAEWHGLTEESDRRVYIEHLARERDALIRREMARLNIEARIREVEAIAEGVLAENPGDGRASVIKELRGAFERGAPVDMRLPGGRPPKAWAESGYDVKRLKVLKDDYNAIVSGSPFDEALEMRSASLLAALAVVLPRVVAAYAETKGGALDFDDLKAVFRDFLRADANLAEAAQSIEYLMVDEFQDTDPVQWSIFRRLLSRGGVNFFCVGDAKQSIYRFRGADVSIFAQACDLVREHNRTVGRPAPDASGLAGSPHDHALGVISLDNNYRSLRVPLLMGNLLFGNLFALRERDQEPVRAREPFDAQAADLQPVKDGSGRVIIQPFLAGENEDENAREDGLEHEGSALASDGAECQCVLDLVMELLGRSGPDSAAERFAPEDIAILVPLNRHVELVQNLLSIHGIECNTGGGRWLLQRQESRDLWCALAALADPGDDLALLGLLRSPLIAASDNALVLLMRSHDFTKDGEHRPRLHTLWRTAQHWPRQLGPEDRRRLRNGYERFQRWRSRAGRVPLAQLVASILVDSGAWAHGARHGREQRAANLERLIGLAREFEQFHGPAPGAFANWLREREQLGDEEGEGEIDAAASGIKIMTIHQAKGREFPAVIGAFLATKRRTNSAPLTLFTPGDGAPPLASLLPENYAVLDASEEGSDKKPARPFVHELARQRAGREEGAELRRKVYVAWTRAERCVALTVRIGKPSRTEGASIYAGADSTSFTMRDGVTSALGLPSRFDEGACAAAVTSLRGWLEESPLGELARHVDIRPVRTGIYAAWTREPLMARETECCRAMLRAAASGGDDNTDAAAADTSGKVLVESPHANLAVSGPATDTTMEIGVRLMETGSFENAEFGELVHAAIERAINTIHSAGTPVISDARALVDAIGGAYDEAARRSAAEHVERGLTRLRAIEGFEHARAEVEIGYVPAPSVSGALPAHVRLDLVIPRGAGRWLIVDTKTGRDDPAYGEQLRRYAQALAAHIQGSGGEIAEIGTALLMTRTGELKHLARYDREMLGLR